MWQHNGEVIWISIVIGMRPSRIGGGFSGIKIIINKLDLEFRDLENLLQFFKKAI